MVLTFFFFPPFGDALSQRMDYNHDIRGIFQCTLSHPGPANDARRLSERRIFPMYVIAFPRSSIRRCQRGKIPP